MKRLMGAALMVGALAGCSNGAATPQPAETQTAKDSIYLEMAREAAPGAKDADLLNIRSKTCETLRNNPTAAGYASIIGAAVKNGAPAELAGKLTALSVASACPEFTKLVG